MTDSEPSDPTAVRALAAAVLRQAVTDAAADPAGNARRARERDDALEFLFSPHCERWCDAVGVDPEALRDRLLRRMPARDEEAERAGP